MAILTEKLADATILAYLYELRSYNPELYDHSSSVALYAGIIGMNYGLNMDSQYELTIAALLHDYGKLFIPKEILCKPGSLTTEERSIVQEHSVLGYSHLKEQQNLSKDILQGILDHHERIDGSGYGNHKKDNEISVYGKIIAIADVYDAMTSDRVYRKRLDKEYVVNYIIDNSGIQFDAGAVESFKKSGITEFNMDRTTYSKKEAC